MRTPKISELESLIFAAELSEDTLSLDLHGMDAHTALHELEGFIQKAFMAGDRVIEVIHGRGDILIPLVKKVFEENEIVEYARGAEQPGKAGGAMYAVIAPKE